MHYFSHVMLILIFLILETSCWGWSTGSSSQLRLSNIPIIHHLLHLHLPVGVEVLGETQGVVGVEMEGRKLLY